MSQFCTMPAGERKIQAAALCREVQGTDGVTMDLGKKLSTPQDIMLEELSLMSNRGSRLFKMRQRRSDKYTFESIQNEANALFHNDPLTQNAEISVDGENTSFTTEDAANAQCIATDPAAEGCGVMVVSKCYHSPWEQAIIHDPDLAETLKLRMPALEPRAELPDYKSFNRVATPFGGFERAPKGIRFRLPEVDLNPPSYPELQQPEMKRPTFNRTAQGWISDGRSSFLPPCGALDAEEVPESEDL
ncbi:Myozenin-2 [Merluccius polli]|uniref:Myozenin-2 n=1 Tax=Merluccius polli TaxID=89951 RepID=A0AA47MG51_MERPO|nr:Myozenin-2 [Merluccius polli]